MTSFRDRTRFATFVAVGLALLVSGVVAGAAGGNFILGQANSAGTSNTSLTTSSTGNALLVTQNGTGTAIRGSTGSGSGIAGFFTIGSGPASLASSPTRTATASTPRTTAPASAAAPRARVQGGVNRGAIATSSQRDTAVGIASCTGFCGANGVSVTGEGLAAGVFGVGDAAIAGVWASEGLGFPVRHTIGTDVPAIWPTVRPAPACRVSARAAQRSTNTAVGRRPVLRLQRRHTGRPIPASGPASWRRPMPVSTGRYGPSGHLPRWRPFHLRLVHWLHRGDDRREWLWIHAQAG